MQTNLTAGCGGVPTSPSMARLNASANTCCPSLSAAKAPAYSDWDDYEYSNKSKSNASGVNFNAMA